MVEGAALFKSLLALVFVLLLNQSASSQQIPPSGATTAELLAIVVDAASAGRETTPEKYQRFWEIVPQHFARDVLLIRDRRRDLVARLGSFDRAVLQSVRLSIENGSATLSPDLDSARQDTIDAYGELVWYFAPGSSVDPDDYDKSFAIKLTDAAAKGTAVDFFGFGEVVPTLDLVERAENMQAEWGRRLEYLFTPPQ